MTQHTKRHWSIFQLLIA